MAHAVNDVGTAGIRNSDRSHWRAAWRQLIYHRGIEIGIRSHCQRAGDRRGGHDQLMRMEALLLAFLPQCQTLMYAKTMLFVDNHQRQAVKLHLFLEDGVCTDNHLHLTAGDGFLLCQPCFTFLLTGEPAHFDTERSKPVTEVIGVLLGE